MLTVRRFSPSRPTRNLCGLTAEDPVLAAREAYLDEKIRIETRGVTRNLIASASNVIRAIQSFF
ncbi:hypothetical protein DVK02_07280 [Halobellus sp. Atlit-31R]|nr:hypothetical protein DVK02_07280 [Halobellus sp. Atlit-31R]